jgi:hypothetical protein
LGVGTQLIPQESLYKRQEAHIQELARRFLTMVKDARARRDHIV